MATNLQFEYNGIVLGEGTPYHLTTIEGFDPPDAREELVDKALDHGGFVYAEFLGYRRPTLAGYLNDNDPETLEGLLAALKSAVAPTPTLLPLTHKFPALPEQRVFCKPVKRAWPKNLDYTLGHIQWSVQWLAGDPRIYSEAENQLVGSGVANNAGDIGAPVVATITGPATDPSITNNTTGRSIDFTLDVGAGEILVVDGFERTAMLDDVSVYASLDTGFKWWDLRPGDNNIAYSGGGTFNLRWRDAWY